MKNISADLTANMAIIEAMFQNSLDFTSRKFKIGSTTGVIYYLSGLVSKQDITLGVLRPILGSPSLEITGGGTMKFLEERVLASAEQIKVYDIDTLAEKVMLGFCALLIDGASYGLCFGVQAFERRSIQEPDNETMQHGAKDGFAEHYQSNISLIRRRMHNPDLKFEQHTIGKDSKTLVILCYLSGKAEKSMLDKVRAKLSECEFDTVMAAGYIAGNLKRSKVFDAIGTTERPDTLCTKLSEGKIGVIIDGTPAVIIYPYLFIENFQCLDDYASRPFYATFIRWIRYLAFVVAVFLPGIYAAILIHRPELLPDILLTKFAAEQSKTPFTVMWELLLVNFLYEVMREAGLRAPKALSQAVSIVGTLVIGDTAVASGMIGAPSLMVIASSAIAGYAIPKLYDQLSVLRLALLFVGSILGTWGIILSGLFLIYNISSEVSLGVPSAAPFAPFKLKAMRDVLFRFSMRRGHKDYGDISNMPGKE